MAGVGASAAFLAGAGFAAFFAAGSAFSFGGAVFTESRSRRTTGASIVDDADLTNSPMSWSWAMRALLSTPNSRASS